MPTCDLQRHIRPGTSSFPCTNFWCLKLLAVHSQVSGAHFIYHSKDFQWGIYMTVKLMSGKIKNRTVVSAVTLQKEGSCLEFLAKQKPGTYLWDLCMFATHMYPWLSCSLPKSKNMSIRLIGFSLCSRMVAYLYKLALW